MEQTLEINPVLKVRRKPTTRKERWAWYFYDFGNSGYAAVVLLAVYSAYFKTQVVGGATGSRLWGFSVGIAMLITAVISPVLGALADFSAAKKRFLILFSGMSIVFTAMLFFVDKGDVVTGMVFFILASLPIFLIVKERSKPQALPPGETYVSIAFKKLAATWKSAGTYKQFVLFIVAFLIFNNAIMMTMDFAGIIGTVLFKMTQTQLIIFMIIVQVTSVIGAFFFGWLTARVSSKRALAFSIVGMIGAVSLIFVAQSMPIFYLVGALAGFALTGVQSVSRTAVGQMAPEEKSAEFFGIHSLAAQISNFTGPTIYGMLATSLALMRERGGMEAGLAEQLGMRGAVVSMVIFLAVGLVVLILVRNWQKLPVLHPPV